MRKNKSAEKDKKYYFGKEEDDAISEYALEENYAKKSKIFEKKIMPAFRKIGEFHYSSFQIARNPEVVDECVVFLYEQLHKFKPEKQPRGFPYFNQIARNFFIQKLNKEKKEIMTDKDISLSMSDATKAESDLFLIDSFEGDIEKAQFLKIFKEHLLVWREKATKTYEKAVVEAIITLFQNSENIDLFNEKAVMFYIREMTGLNNKQIKSNLNKIKKKFFRLSDKYDRGEF